MPPRLFDAEVVERESGARGEQHHREHHHGAAFRRADREQAAEQAEARGERIGHALVGAEQARLDAEAVLQGEGESEAREADDRDPGADAAIDGAGHETPGICELVREKLKGDEAADQQNEA